MQIRYYGRLLELSRYEFGLLKTLAARPGHVYSRDALLERVWGSESERSRPHRRCPREDGARQDEGRGPEPGADPHPARQRLCLR